MFQKLFTLYKKSEEWDMGMQYAFDVCLRTTETILHRKRNEISCHNYDSIIHCICKLPLFIPCVRLNFIILKVCALTLPYSSHFTKLNEIVSFKKVIYRVNDINCFVCINTC